MAKDTFYFTHDYNARTDKKIKRLLSKLGYLGYGLFWAIIEDLYNNANELPLDYESMSFDLKSDESTIKTIINDFELFVISDGFFTSDSVQRRLDERCEKSTKARESAQKRWNKKVGDANALQSQCNRNAIKERKGKEKKENINLEISKERFDKFWASYAKSADKKKCEEKFINLEEDVQEKILTVVDDYVRSTPEVKFRKNPLTWINGECWNDEIIIPNKKDDTVQIGTGAQMTRKELEEIFNA